MRNILLMTDTKVLKKEYANIDESNGIITTHIDKLDKTITSEKGRENLKHRGQCKTSICQRANRFFSTSQRGQEG